MQILMYALKTDIINIDDVRTKLEMKNNQEILEAHEYKIWQGKDGNWYTHVYDPSKKEKRRLIKRKTESKLHKELIKIYKTKEKKEITLEDLYPEWLDYLSLHTTKSASVKRYTSEWNKYYVSSPIIKQPIKQLNTLILDKWVHNMIKTYNLNRKKYYTMTYIIRHCMEYAKDNGYIKKNAFKKVKVDAKMFQKVKKKTDETQVYLEYEQPLIIEEAWKDYNQNPENTTPLAVILEFYLGTRAGEIVAIKESDVEEDYINIQRMEVGVFEQVDIGTYKRTGRTVVEHTKSDAGDRRVPLIGSAKEVIQLILSVNQRNKCSGKYLFMKDGQRIHASAVSWRLEKYCNHLGISYRSLHKIRKTVISSLIDSNVNINTIRKIVGHEDEKTTYRNYCFDRKAETQIRKQIELALDKKPESFNVVLFKNIQSNNQVTTGNQSQAI